ncbi:MAG: hypothetical protein AAF352_07000 [Pseudomonadota bacterium]
MHDYRISPDEGTKKHFIMVAHALGLCYLIGANLWWCNAASLGRVPKILRMLDQGQYLEAQPRGTIFRSAIAG